MSFNVQSFTCTYNTITHIHGATPLVSPSPCWFPSTYLAPSSCDRNRPPPSQVACKLTPFAPPFTQLSHPLQIPRTPTAPRPTMTTSGIFRLLLSGTMFMFMVMFLFIVTMCSCSCSCTCLNPCPAMLSCLKLIFTALVLQNVFVAYVSFG